MEEILKVSMTMNDYSHPNKQTKKGRGELTSV